MSLPLPLLFPCRHFFLTIEKEKVQWKAGSHNPHFYMQYGQIRVMYIFSFYIKKSTVFKQIDFLPLSLSFITCTYVAIFVILLIKHLSMCFIELSNTHTQNSVLCPFMNIIIHKHVICLCNTFEDKIKMFWNKTFIYSIHRLKKSFIHGKKLCYTLREKPLSHF